MGQAEETTEGCFADPKQEQVGHFVNERFLIADKKISESLGCAQSVGLN